jgi:DNA ligase-1
MFTPLFGESSKGKRKRWEVSVEEREGHGHITVTHGFEDGKQVVSERVVTSGKNLGKKNATTPYQQSLLEARALWKKKTDAGYAEEEKVELPSTEAEEVVACKPPSPMLAHDFNKRGKDVVFPCYAQRKLDGVRCMAVSQRGLFSRNGKRLSLHLHHVQREVDQLPKDTVLDGELYSDTLTFQEIVGLVKKAALGEGDDAKLQSIYLCVYDAVQLDTSFEARNAWLTRTFEGLGTTVGMKLLPTVVCAAKDAIAELHAAYVAEGYEGIMLRNKAGVYSAGHRSKDLQKFKLFEDDEFVVCGYKTGDGSEKECVIWICLTSDNKHFAVRPRGTHQERQAALLTADSKVSCMYTVRYQELTSDGIPRFPVGIGFRDFE